jgi:hypothetical protein
MDLIEKRHRYRLLKGTERSIRLRNILLISPLCLLLDTVRLIGGAVGSEEQTQFEADIQSSD